jgi:hypothetical protein
MEKAQDWKDVFQHPPFYHKDAALGAGRSHGWLRA